MNPDHVLTVPEGTPPARLDAYLAGVYSEYSRSRLQRWIRQGHVLVLGQRAEPAREINPGEEISITVPPEETSVLPQSLPLDILYEDAHVLAVCKPSGQVTHPAARNFTGTLLNAAVHHLKEGGGRKGKGLRPGVVHRLDRETSGVLVIAKDAKSLEILSRQFEKRTVEKIYRAVVCGRMEHKKGEIVGAVGKDSSGSKMAVTTSGKYARTDFKLLENKDDFAYLEAYPKTGRTHQIRVHLAKIGHPVLGDPLYSNPAKDAPRMMLHAWRLTFTHPKTNKSMTLTAPLPEDFQKALKKLNFD